MNILGWNISRNKGSSVPRVSVDELKSFVGDRIPYSAIFDGDKYIGGFGPTEEQVIDYWTLRARSAQLYNENLYARGLIRRLITNEINTGLTPETEPNELVLGLEEGSLNKWTEEVESRFGIWAKEPRACDFKKANTFGAIQRIARAEALVCGDVLVISRQSPVTKQPAVQLITGNKVMTPFQMGKNKLAKDHKIKHGVETDKFGRQVAYWIRQDDSSSKRIPAYGEKSKRRIAWLVYGTDKRMDDVRGTPLLSLVLQSLKEIDRYRDSVQRKAVMNAVLAMFIKKTEDKMSTLPGQGGATRKDNVTVQDSDGKTRDMKFVNHIPGLVMEELEVGEEPVGFHNQGTDEKFGEFEEAIIQAVAWANETPPEILRLAFSNNYSASQAAINEFKIYINKVWSEWGETFCTPIYIEWLISQVLLSKIKANGLLEAWRDTLKLDEFGAWIQVQWYGSIKPSTDMLKQAKGSILLVKEGWSNNARESRILTGTKFSQNMKRITQENEAKARAALPIVEFWKEHGITPEQALSAPIAEGKKNDN